LGSRQRPDGVVNLGPDFLAFWEQARGLERDEQARLWHELYESRHPAVFDVYYAGFGSRSELDRALGRFPAVVPRLGAAARRVDAAAAEVVPACAALFQVPERSVPLVALVGLFCSDAWAWPLRGEWTAFLALEMLAAAEPRRLRITVAHEAAHALHARCLALPGDGSIATVRSLGLEAFAEGIATVASARAVPGAGEAAYLNLGADAPAWRAACRRLWPFLRRAFLDGLKSTDPAALAAYFHAEPEAPPPGTPPRAGYFVGYRVVETLARRHSIAAMAHWPIDRCLREVGRSLEDMRELQSARAGFGAG
jgi:hypothetical protein